MIWSQDLVDGLLAEGGQPVAGHSLSTDELREALAQGRVFRIDYWSTMGDGEAWFSPATDLHIGADGRAQGSLLVFPQPVPADLRRSSQADWESIDEVYQAFGL
ncbi:hypothetical protein [Catellatospora vulcania]|uniref:hypothetical protein n=1 Tax=Catellatospora vulcania TaxID=1460450 RepID=UPI0018AF8336|nr:hypothetical protein [Catellatospora vulcania]